jgi:hypothetical protein
LAQNLQTSSSVTFDTEMARPGKPESDEGIVRNDSQRNARTALQVLRPGVVKSQEWKLPQALLRGVECPETFADAGGEAMNADAASEI